jgi:hypothetical protein
VKETKELEELPAAGEADGDGIDNSLHMVAWIKFKVNYYLSTSIGWIDLLCSNDSARRRKQRGRVHCGLLQWLRRYVMRRARSARIRGARFC